jgi:hypothetical protein
MRSSKMLPSVVRRTSATATSDFRGSITQPIYLLSTLRRLRHHNQRKTRFRPVWLDFDREGLSPSGFHMQLSGCHQNTFHPFHCTRLLLAHSNNKLLLAGGGICPSAFGGKDAARSRIWSLVSPEKTLDFLPTTSILRGFRCLLRTE